MSPRTIRARAASVVWVGVVVLGLDRAAGFGAAARPVRPNLHSRHDITGTWRGTLDIHGVPHAIALQLHDRPGGELLAYVLGGTRFRSVAEGRRAGRHVRLALERESPAATTQIAITGRLEDDMITGIVTGGPASDAVSLRRTDAVLVERRFVFALFDGGDEPSASSELAVALDGSTLVAGSFVGERNCDLWSCEGIVTAFSESPGGVLKVGLAADGPCPGGGEATVTFDPSTKTYSGAYTFTDCGGPRSGPVLAARLARSRTDHITSIMVALARLAGDLETGAPLDYPHASFSPTYLHNGRTQQDVLGSFNAELARYTGILAGFRRLRGARTEADPDIFPDFIAPSGLDFDAVRSGVRAGEGERSVYVDTRAWPERDNQLRVWSAASDDWRILGNQLPPIDLPFSYSFGSTSLEIPTPGGTVHVSVGPFGGHFGPITGHGYGDAKANFVGFFTRGDGDLTELEGDGDGVREPGETWGLWGGADGDLIRSRIPLYIAPLAGEIVELRYEAGPPGDTFDDRPQWGLSLALSDEVGIRLGHVGALASGLRDKVLAAAGVDTSSYAGPAAELLGGVRIPVSAGEPLAYPQVVSMPVPGHPGYYAGSGSFLARPWVQIEPFADGPTGAGGTNVCVFELMSSADQTAIQAVLDADMADPASQRYADWNAPPRWQWGAEGRLCMAYSPIPRDFSSLFTNLGGWFEIEGPTTTFDELVGFAQIATDAATYDPSLYDSPSVTALILRRKSLGSNFAWEMPDGSTLNPFYPNGEILSLTADTLLIKWRDIGYAPGGVNTPVYQRAAYILDENGLKILWGKFAATRGGATPPSLTATVPCNDTNVICYDHTFHHGI